jgi:hypothetical protein
MQFRTTGTSKVNSVSCCSLFDPMDGKIRHVCRIATIEGAPDTPMAELESQTLKLARDLGLDTARLRVMHEDEKGLSSHVTTRSVPHRSLS